MEILLGIVCFWVLFLLVPNVVDRILEWNGLRTFPWWRYRIYWESWLGDDDQPIEVSTEWALERIRLANQRPTIVLRAAVQGRIISGGRITVRDGEKAIRLKERAVPDDSEFSYYRVLRPLTSWRAIAGQTALDTIGKHGMDVVIGMERLHNGEILHAGPYRVLATPISEHIRP